MKIYFNWKNNNTGAYSSSSIVAKSMDDIDEYIAARQRLGYKNLGVHPGDNKLYKQWENEQKKQLH